MAAPGFDIKEMATNAVDQAKRTLSNVTTAKDLSALVPSSISQLQSASTQVVGAVKALAKDPLGAFNVDISKLISAPSMIGATVPADSKPPYPNPLGVFASYTYIITLSILDDNAINNPDSTYKVGVPQRIICKSASGSPFNRVETGYGKFDYFIETLNLDSIFGFDKATGNTNATTMKFTIVEPYSMGLFMQACSIAAIESGNSNYTEAPFLLTIEFKGFTEQNETIDLPQFTKHQPIKLTTVNMKVTQKGSTYSIEALAWNDHAFSDRYKKFKTDFSFSGKTVQEVLQTGEKSLQAAVNKFNQSQKESAQVTDPDQILILFPQDIASSATSASAGDTKKESSATATTNPSTSASSQTLFQKLGVTQTSTTVLSQDTTSCNAIGQASLSFSAAKKGDQPFAKENKTYNATTGTYVNGNIEYDPSKSEFKFKQDSDIINAINQVVLQSDYAKLAVSGKNIDNTGCVPWWRIETQLYQLGSGPSAATGSKPKLVVYRVVPYRVHAGKIMPPNTPPPAIKALKSQAIKEYNYIYTGKNTDVMDFNIEISAAFYTSFPADGNNKSADVQDKDKNSSIDTGDQKSTRPAGEAISPYGSSGSKARPDGTKTGSDKKGGGGSDTIATRVARQYHDAFTESTDMCTMDMKIIGDPYYIGDSGQGNYTAKSTDYKNLTADGSIDYQTSEVDIIVNFRTPIDINQGAGMYDFADSKLLTSYSGLFKVNTVAHTFASGKFTQSLSLTRRTLQEASSDFEAQGKSADSKVPSLEPAAVPPTTPAQEFVNSTNNSVLAALGTNNNVNKTPSTTPAGGDRGTRGGA
jgi:hypothetical protein